MDGQITPLPAIGVRKALLMEKRAFVEARITPVPAVTEKRNLVAKRSVSG